MDYKELLLVIMQKEAIGVANQISRCLKFGPNEVQPGKILPNCERVQEKLISLEVVYKMAMDQAIFPEILTGHLAMAKKQKEKDIDRMIAYSEECGVIKKNIEK